MTTNKMTIVLSLIIILLCIGITTTYKIVKNYHNNLIKVVNAKIIAAAQNCYYEEKCFNHKIFLKDLYEHKYLEKINNPITKEYYKEESYIINEDNYFTFYAK